MNKNKLLEILNIILYGDIYKVPHSILKDYELCPKAELNLDMEQSIRVSMAATLKELLENTEKCKFCNSEVITFDEHYTFCTSCSAIYTQMMVSETNCEHINENSLYVERAPWFKAARNTIPYIKVEADKCSCSVCGKQVMADGW